MKKLTMTIITAAALTLAGQASAGCNANNDFDRGWATDCRDDSHSSANQRQSSGSNYWQGARETVQEAWRQMTDDERSVPNRIDRDLRDYNRSNER